jgi:hypothetical protein
LRSWLAGPLIGLQSQSSCAQHPEGRPTGKAPDRHGSRRLPAPPSLQGCTLLTDVGVACLAALRTLQAVVLPPGVTDAALRALCALPMLQRVVLRECASVTPVGVCALLRAPALRRVVVSKCPQV